MRWVLSKDCYGLRFNRPSPGFIAAIRDLRVKALAGLKLWSDIDRGLRPIAKPLSWAEQRTAWAKLRSDRSL